ncbi:CwfJ C-terminus 1-domain-containing protein-like protein [Syncephalis plumigaleata]|nr:CwfJ C-terminus 1-domain-containing protein-like protein [Syncephalis plumigaleata]
MKEHSSNHSATRHSSRHDEVKRKKKKKHASHERKKDKRRHRSDHKRRRHRSESVSSSSTSSSDTEQTSRLPVDLDEEDLWVEKPSSVVSNPVAAAAAVEPSISNDKPATTDSTRSSWMLEAPEALEGFNVIEPKKAPPPPPPIDEIKVSDRELNKHLVAGTALEDYPEMERKAKVFGDSGSNWRMLKLKRTLEMAKEEKRPLEQVAMERYASLEEFEDAMSERRWLDQRASSSSRKHDTHSSKRIRTAATSAFKRPKAFHHDDSDDNDEQHRYRSTSTTSSVDRTTRSSASPPPPQYRTIGRSSAMPTTTAVSTTSNSNISSPAISCLSQNELNQLQARALRARMLGTPDADTLEEQYKLESEKAKTVNNPSMVVLTEMELRGRRGVAETDRKSKGKQQLKDTHDQHGARKGYGQTGEDASIEELVREERTTKSSADYRKAMVKGITRDSRFQRNLLTRTATTQQVRRDAIGNYQRAQKALDRCYYCFREGQPPVAPVIALGHRVYLALPVTEPLVAGHCLIVPVQHQLSMLECEDDVWTEVRNFMKCLLRMFHAEGRGCLFMETVVNLDWHRHTVIECIPMDDTMTQDAPAYYKESILAADDEWTQHRKLYDTRQKGFRQSMTAQLPYFHVWFTLDGGYGHIIENQEQFPSYFGLEVAGSMLDLPPQTWRKPRRLSPDRLTATVTKFKSTWEPFDWTKALET